MPNSPLLDLAEAYYKVAADLDATGQQYIETARMLANHADQLCEANIKETRTDEAGEVKP